MDEIYHDESLGVHINIVLVRMIMVGYRQVNTALGRGEEEMLIRLAPAFRLLSWLEPCSMREGGSLKCYIGAAGSCCFSQGQQACSDTMA